MLVPIIYNPGSSIGFWCTPLPRLSLQRFEEDEDVSRWRGFLSSVGLSLPASLCRLASPALRLGQRRMLQGKAPDIPEHVLRLAGVGPDKLRSEWSLPAFVAMFLPEFPHKTVPGHEHFQVDPDSGTNTLFSLFHFFLFFWPFLVDLHQLLVHLCLSVLTRCWVTSPKVHLDPYWKWKTRPNRKHTLSKWVLCQNPVLSL